MNEIKMSDVFELPVRASQLEVYGANSNPDITFEDIKKAAAHAINNYDKLTETVKHQQEIIDALVDMLEQIISSSDDAIVSEDGGENYYVRVVDDAVLLDAEELLNKIKGESND